MKVASEPLFYSWAEFDNTSQHFEPSDLNLQISHVNCVRLSVQTIMACFRGLARNFVCDQSVVWICLKWSFSIWKDFNPEVLFRSKIDQVPEMQRSNLNSLFHEGRKCVKKQHGIMQRKTGWILPKYLQNERILLNSNNRWNQYELNWLVSTILK